MFFCHIIKLFFKHWKLKIQNNYLVSVHKVRCLVQNVRVRVRASPSLVQNTADKGLRSLENQEFTLVND